jgi:hypothetical protein
MRLPVWIAVALLIVIFVVIALLTGLALDMIRTHDSAE